jgi:Phospholipase_D-nuclease N-terminal
MGLETSGIVGLLILIADVWAIIHIAQSRSAPGNKALWIVLVLVLPVLGLILWLVLGPRAAKA